MALYHPLSNEIENILFKNSFKRNKVNPSYQFTKNEAHSTFFNQYFNNPNHHYFNNPFCMRVKEKIFNDKLESNKRISSENFKNILKHIGMRHDEHKLNIKSLTKIRKEILKDEYNVKIDSAFLTNLRDSERNANKLHQSQNFNNENDGKITKRSSIYNSRKRIDTVNSNNDKRLNSILSSEKSKSHGKFMVMTEIGKKCKKNYNDIIKFNEYKRSVCYKPPLIKKMDINQILFKDLAKKFPSKVSKVNSIHTMIHLDKTYLKINNSDVQLPLIKIDNDNHH